MAQLFVTAAGDVASILDPFLKGVFRTIAATFSSVGSLGADLASLVQDFTQNDLSGAVARLGAFAWDLTRAVIVNANWWQRILIGGGIAVVAAGDAASAGAAQYALTAVGIYQLTTDLSMFFASTLSRYNTIYPNG